MLFGHITTEEEFVSDLERRLSEDNIKLIDFEYKEDIIEVKFELDSYEEEWVEAIRSRVETVTIRIVNKYFNIYGQAVSDTYYFEKNQENVINIELF